jgi:single-strand DNA-binding protein
MSRSKNTIFLVGNLGRSPEIRETPNGKRLATFPVATNDRCLDEHMNLVKQTNWHRVTVFGKLIDIADQYLHKGCLVAVEGSIHWNTWTNGAGLERESVEIQVTPHHGKLTFLSGRVEAVEFAASDNNSTVSKTNEGHIDFGDPGAIPF